MSILGRLLGVKKQEPLSLHTMVSNELRMLVNHVVAGRDMERSIQIRDAINSDTMQWFRIRPRDYGESGSHYGVAEIVGHPRSEAMWPAWMKLIPGAELESVALDVYSMSNERAPMGGQNMDDENRLRAVCEFTGQVMSRLSEMEAESRGSL